MLTGNKQLGELSHKDIKDLMIKARDALLMSQFDADSLQQTLNQLLVDTAQKPAVLFSLIRLAVSWAPFSPALNDTLAVIGHDRVQSRLQTAIETIR